MVFGKAGLVRDLMRHLNSGFPQSFETNRLSWSEVAKLYFVASVHYSLASVTNIVAHPIHYNQVVES